MRSSSSAFSSSRRRRSASKMRSPVSMFSMRRMEKSRCSMPGAPEEGEERAGLGGVSF